MPQTKSNYDITDQRFGLLTAITPVAGANRTAQWRCKCDCGIEKIVAYRNLLYGKTKSCGCSRGTVHIKDLTGRRFGRLTAVERTAQKKNSSYLWRCKCDCGREVLVTASALTKGQRRSCGCLAAEAKSTARTDIQKQRFGRLIALEPTEIRNKGGSVIWRCVCDCGNETYQPASVLLEGRVVSCGCKKRENDVLQRKLDYIDGTCIQFITNTDKVSAGNSSGYRGIRSVGTKWQARISFKKKSYSLGTYERLEEAISVRKKAESILYGEFLDWYYETFPEKLQIREESAD